VISHDLLIAIGISAFLTLAAGLSGLVFGALRAPRMSKLQLSGDPEQVADIVQGNPRAVRRLQHQLVADYVFIFCYWLTFIGLAVAIARRGGTAYSVVGLIVALAGSLTALLDVVENVRTRGVLALTRPGDQVRRQPVAHLRLSSLAKWGASALTVALLAILFLPGQGRLFWLGFACLAVAAIGLAGLRWNRLIAPFFLGFFALGAVIAVSFTFFADGVLERL
jgi:hypothetical protein